MNNRILELLSLPVSHTILDFPHKTRWQYSDENSLPTGRRVQVKYVKSLFSTNVLLHRVLSTVRASGVVKRVSPDHGKLVALIGGSNKRRRLLIAGDGRRSTMHQ